MKDHLKAREVGQAEIASAIIEVVLAMFRDGHKAVVFGHAERLAQGSVDLVAERLLTLADLGASAKRVSLIAAIAESNIPAMQWRSAVETPCGTLYAAVKCRVEGDASLRPRLAEAALDQIHRLQPGPRAIAVAYGKNDRPPQRICAW